METLVESSSISTIREVWWDIRPHPDFGTVELSRMQLWQWMAHSERFAEGPTMSTRLLDRMLEDEIALLRRRGAREELLAHAVRLLRDSVVAEEAPPFLSVLAYEVLVSLDDATEGAPAA